jgi:phage terminase large subunit
MPEVKLTNVFKRTGDALLNAINGTGPRLIVNQGGQGSSKTYSTLQVIYTYLKNSENKKATFCSYALPHLKKGVCSDFDKILGAFGENIGEVKSAPAQPIYHIGESEIDCYGIEGNLAMAHGPRRDILYINECNRRISYEVFDQLFSRSQITLMDFNPDQEFWLHEKVLPNFPYVLIKSNFLDNPYLPENELNNILMKKDKPGFENWWKVYGMGELGRLEGAIFPNWKYGDFDKSLPYSFGMDFGYNDPDTLTKVAIDRRAKKIYIEECIYKNGLTPGDLREQVGKYASSRDLIVADCADARMIAELQRWFNIHKAIKSSGSVQEGIRLMQDFELIVTEDSTNIVKELSNYIWSDSKAGVPIQAFDHALDGIRYNVTYNLWDTIRRPVMTRKN